MDFKDRELPSQMFYINKLNKIKQFSNIGTAFLSTRCLPKKKKKKWVLFIYAYLINNYHVIINIPSILSIRTGPSFKP